GQYRHRQGHPRALPQDDQALRPRYPPVRHAALRQRRQRTARVHPEPGALSQVGSHHRARELRLRLLARARAMGAARLRHPLRDRAELRRHLLQQQLQERHPADPPAARDLRPAHGGRQARRQRARHHRSRPPGRRPPERRGNPLRRRSIPQALAAEWPGRRRPNAAAPHADRQLRDHAAPGAALDAQHRRHLTHNSAHRKPAMPANKKLLVLPGDGIGPEVMREVRRVIDWMDRRRMVTFDMSEDLVGGAALDARGVPITDETMEKARDTDAILFGSVGGPKWDALGFDKRPEIAILRLRKELDLFANLRPAIVLDPLVDASTLKPDIVRGLNLMIVRESTGGIYFGEPR